MVLQYGFGKTPEQIAAMTRDAIAALGKPVVAGEYNITGSENTSRSLGNAALSAGAAGFGNGAGQMTAADVAGADRARPGLYRKRVRARPRRGETISSTCCRVRQPGRRRRSLQRSAGAPGATAAVCLGSDGGRSRVSGVPGIQATRWESTSIHKTM